METQEKRATHVAVPVETFEKIANYLVTKPLMEVEALVNEIRNGKIVPITLEENAQGGGKIVDLTSSQESE